MEKTGDGGREITFGPFSRVRFCGTALENGPDEAIHFEIK
jgi:hypothetical protein